MIVTQWQNSLKDTFLSIIVIKRVWLCACRRMQVLFLQQIALSILPCYRVVYRGLSLVGLLGIIVKRNKRPPPQINHITVPQKLLSSKRQSCPLVSESYNPHSGPVTPTQQLCLFSERMTHRRARSWAPSAWPVHTTVLSGSIHSGFSKTSFGSCSLDESFIWVFHSGERSLFLLVGFTGSNREGNTHGFTAVCWLEGERPQIDLDGWTVGDVVCGGLRGVALLEEVCYKRQSLRI